MMEVMYIGTGLVRRMEGHSRRCDISMSGDIQPIVQEPLNPVDLQTSEIQGYPPGNPSGGDWRVNFRNGSIEKDLSSGEIISAYVKSLEDLEKQLVKTFKYKVLTLDASRLLYEASGRFAGALYTLRKSLNHKQDADPDSPSLSALQDDASSNLYKAFDDFLAALEYFDSYRDFELAESLKNVKLASMELDCVWKLIGFEGPHYIDHFEFIASRMEPMTSRLKNIEEALRRFIETGVPCIAEAQKRRETKCNNAATVSTFFAGVIASTLQFTVTDDAKDSSALSAANTLLMTSLVFSIAAAFNSMATIAIQKAVYARPGRIQPTLIRIWTRHSHIWFLTLSVGLYLSGLGTFAFHTQRPNVAWIVFSFTTLSALGLAVNAIWLFNESLQVHKIFRAGLKHLSVKYLIEWWSNMCHRLSDWLSRRRRHAQTQRHSQRWIHRMGFVGSEATPNDQIMFSKETNVSPVQAVKGKFKETAKNKNDDIKKPKEELTCQDFIGKLKDKEQWTSIGTDNWMHLNHFKFSPDGLWLVEYSTRQCLIRNVQERLRVEFIIPGSTFSQVMWSPNGKNLLVVLRYSAHLWNYNHKDNELVQSNQWLHIAEFIHMEWISDNELLVLKEDGMNLYKLYRIDFANRAIAFYPVQTKLDLQNMYSLRNRRVAITAQLKIEAAGKKYMDVLIVYMLPSALHEETETHRIQKKCTILLTDNVTGLAVSKDGDYILIGYETKAPEIWWVKESCDDIRIVRQHCFQLPKGRPVKNDGSWGMPFFAGPDEAVVGCTYQGEIHFWQLHTKSYVVSLPSKENINEMQDPRDKVMSVWSLGLQMPLLMYYTYKAGRMNIWGWQSAHASPALCNPATEAPKQSTGKLRKVKRIGQQMKMSTERDDSTRTRSRQVPGDEAKEDLQPETKTSKDTRTETQND